MVYHKYFGKQIEGFNHNYSLWRNVYNKHPVVIFYIACVFSSVGILTYKYFTKFQKPIDEMCRYKDSYHVVRHEDMKDASKPYYSYKTDWELQKEESS